MGALIVPISEPEWKSGRAGQEIVVPQEPTKPPVVPTRPPTKPQPVDEEGLWFYYDFDSTQVTPEILTGLSGYEDPGFQDLPATPEVIGDPELVRGVFGNAWQFNGATKLDLDNFEAFERVFSQETVTVWFKADATRSATAGNVFMIYEEGGGTNGMCLYIANDKLNVATRDGGADFQKTLAVPFTDTRNWHHATVVYNAGNLSLYLDGAAVGSLETGYPNDGEYTAAISQHTSDASIGGGQGACTGVADNAAYYAGLLDEFMVYNYAFTPGQVASVARGMAVAPQEKLAVSWGSAKSR